MAPDDPESDASLAARSISGDRRAFGLLVDRHGPFLAKAARGIGLPESDVDDIVQETFVAAWRDLARYDPDRPIRTWLYRIAINKTRDALRHRRVRRFFFGAARYEDVDEAQLVEPGASPERIAAGKHDLQRVHEVLDQLDRASREVITLHALLGVTQLETAQILNLSTKAVEGRIARARRRLGVILAARAQNI